MAFHKPKPETLRRIGRELREEQARRTARLRADLAERAERDGPDSIWAEMLVEHDKRHEND